MSTTARDADANLDPAANAADPRGAVRSLARLRSHIAEVALFLVLVTLGSIWALYNAKYCDDLEKSAPHQANGPALASSASVP